MNEAKLNLRLTPELLEAARREARRRKLTLSDWIRSVMTEAIGGPLLPSTKRSSTKAKRKRR
jgi:predicted HicB family RNase H-like nuclease